ncbi:helix-turn-helix domain-containing protein [Streptomyces sp. NPDC005485]|uniref:AraC-like ligand-binding domain-containing protein n=1 Tax=Streptomyces sp. NPDC005485 TaxID=3155591 RepID=UPI0033B1BC58
MPRPQPLSPALHLSLSTETGPPTDRMTSWKQALSRAFVSLEVLVDNPGAWRASVYADRIGPLQIATEESDPVKFMRTPEEIASDNQAYIFARLQLHGTVALFQDGRSTELRPGLLAFYDAGRPFKLVMSERYRSCVLMMPRQLLRLDDTQVRQLTATPVGDAPGGPAALLLPLLSGLVAEVPATAPPLREKLARTIADLLATLAAGQLTTPGFSPAGAGPTLLDQVKASVERRLGEPELSPRLLADEHNISLRYLHKLFHEQGTTVGRWVRQRRLEACKEELARHDGTDRVIGTVAARWGFSSPAHFSHVFRSAYGMSPGEWRSTAAGAARSR